MHFYLPKPLHGWRAFAGEVGIIVVGVLIALGAEQLVETLHWRHQTRETVESLQVEIQDSVNAADERFAVDDCLRGQLAALKGAIPGGVAQARVIIPANQRRVIGDLYATPWRAWARGTWDSAVASNALNHLSSDRLSAYAQTYKAIEDLDTIVRRERDAKGGLAPLALGPLSAEQAGEVLGTLTNLDRDRSDMLIAGGDLTASAAALGIRPAVSRAEAVASFKLRYGVCG